MANYNIYLNRAVKSITRATADDGWIAARSTRDGALFVASWYDALALEGRVYAANMGTVTSPITFLATAANRPDAWVRVPSGTSILPLSLQVALEDNTGTNLEIDVRIASNDIGNGTSSAASVGPRAFRTDAPQTSNCTARQLATADTTAETTPLTVFRRSYSLAEASGNNGAPFEITREMMGYPVCVGAATWEVFVAADSAPVGFVVMTWAEIPSTDLT